jgi:hypothetical protein
VRQIVALGLKEIMFIIWFSFWQENYYGRHQALGIWHQALEAGLLMAGIEQTLYWLYWFNSFNWFGLCRFP